MRQTTYLLHIAAVCCVAIFAWSAMPAREAQGQTFGGSQQGFSSSSSFPPSFQNNAGLPGNFTNPTDLIPAAPTGGASESVGSEPEVSEDPAGETRFFGGLAARLMMGGPLMVPLGLCSLVVIALAVERFVALRRGRVIPRPFVRRFTECVQDGQLSHEEALEICDEFECPVADVFHAAVRRWGRPTVEIEQAVMDAGERIADGLRKYLRLFSAISNIAPLLGLLGTVLGMIEAFEALSSATTDAPTDSLASGISQALVTTAAGLSVAIPAYLAHVYFAALADRYLVEIDSICQQVVDSISAEGLQGTSSGRSNPRRTKKAA